MLQLTTTDGLSVRQQVQTMALLPRSFDHFLQLPRKIPFFSSSTGAPHFFSLLHEIVDVKLWPILLEIGDRRLCVNNTRKRFRLARRATLCCRNVVCLLVVIHHLL